MHASVINKPLGEEKEVKLIVTTNKNKVNLFNNAAKDPVTTQIFSGLQNAPIKEFHKEEVLKEKPKVNPFAALEEKNAALDQARLDAARSSVGEVLIKEPKCLPTHSEFITQADESFPETLRAAESAKNLAALNFRHRRAPTVGAPEIKKKI